tara:strand:+ start:632 stop:1117 length:486 start_codon:yes stop_codon:yes gene_type:complete
MHHLFKLKKIFLILPLFFLLTACPVERNIAQKTPAELMAMQTRDFDTNKENAIGGIIAVFQDLGFIIETSDFNTGLITAKSPTQGNYSLWGRKMVDTKGTGTVREMGSDKVKIRLNFVESKRVSFGYGMKQENESPILDAAVYQDAFSKIRNQLFIQKSTN